MEHLMDLFLSTLLYCIYGIVIMIIFLFLCYILITQNILKMVLKKSAAKIIPRSEVPEYLTKFYEIKESQLLNLGFTYQFCIFTEDLIIKECPQRHIFIYYNPQEKTYAKLTSDIDEANLMPFQVEFETHFKNGKKLITLNGLKHNLIGTIPNAILNDAYAETQEKHFQFHLQCLAEIANREGEVEEFVPSYSEIFLKKFIQNREDYLDHLVQKDIAYKLGEDKYGIKPLASLGIAHRRMFSGLKKMDNLRKKILALKNKEQGW